MSVVSETPPAAADAAAAHFARKLELETDCWDVHAATRDGTADFVLLDVRTAALYDRGHVPDAVSLPRRAIDAERLAAWPADTLFVVYCAGPHCNGADKAALALAQLGRKVKLMIGGVTGWLDEGLALEPALPRPQAAAAGQRQG